MNIYDQVHCAVGHAMNDLTDNETKLNNAIGDLIVWHLINMGVLEKPEDAEPYRKYWGPNAFPESFATIVKEQHGDKARRLTP